ncbi:hypothetical protein MLD38_005147 [Melastoma candidum]|uniref:Uncharacterized protein n=1 Tax=Melastoma candidum TaxID=119954 RepID=A0ACB9SBV0_9MYRT|nr:hypothetical protein MLD38_005147 [Melastoma candidum]
MEQEKLDCFNIPLFSPCPREVEMEVEDQGAFSITHFSVSELSWSSYSDEPDLRGLFDDDSYILARSVRAVVEPILLNHFGGEIIEDCFERYRKLIALRVSKEKPNLIKVIVSLVRNYDCAVINVTKRK